MRDSGHYATVDIEALTSKRYGCVHCFVHFSPQTRSGSETRPGPHLQCGAKGVLDTVSACMRAEDVVQYGRDAFNAVSLFLVDFGRRFPADPIPCVYGKCAAGPFAHAAEFWAHVRTHQEDVHNVRMASVPRAHVGVAADGGGGGSSSAGAGGVSASGPPTRDTLPEGAREEKARAQGAQLLTLLANIQDDLDSDTDAGRLGRVRQLFMHFSSAAYDVFRLHDLCAGKVTPLVMQHLDLDAAWEAPDASALDPASQQLSKATLAVIAEALAGVVGDLTPSSARGFSLPAAHQRFLVADTGVVDVAVGDDDEPRLPVRHHSVREVVFLDQDDDVQAAAGGGQRSHVPLAATAVRGLAIASGSAGRGGRLSAYGPPLDSVEVGYAYDDGGTTWFRLQFGTQLVEVKSSATVASAALSTAEADRLCTLSKIDSVQWTRYPQLFTAMVTEARSALRSIIDRLPAGSELATVVAKGRMPTLQQLIPELVDSSATLVPVSLHEAGDLLAVYFNTVFPGISLGGELSQVVKDIRQMYGSGMVSDIRWVAQPWAVAAQTWNDQFDAHIRVNTSAATTLDASRRSAFARSTSVPSFSTILNQAIAASNAVRQLELRQGGTLASPAWAGGGKPSEGRGYGSTASNDAGGFRSGAGRGAKSKREGGESAPGPARSVVSGKPSSTRGGTVTVTKRARDDPVEWEKPTRRSAARCFEFLETGSCTKQDCVYSHEPTQWQLDQEQSLAAALAGRATAEARQEALAASARPAVRGALALLATQQRAATVAAPPAGSGAGPRGPRPATAALGRFVGGRAASPEA